MKITNLKVNNYPLSSKKWLNFVKANPKIPLINVTIISTLSWNEYKALLKKNKRA